MKVINLYVLSFFILVFFNSCKDEMEDLSSSSSTSTYFVKGKVDGEEMIFNLSTSKIAAGYDDISESVEIYGTKAQQYQMYSEGFVINFSTDENGVPIKGTFTPDTEEYGYIQYNEIETTYYNLVENISLGGSTHATITVDKVSTFGKDGLGRLIYEVEGGFSGTVHGESNELVFSHVVTEGSFKTLVYSDN